MCGDARWLTSNPKDVQRVNESLREWDTESGRRIYAGQSELRPAVILAIDVRAPKCPPVTSQRPNGTLRLRPPTGMRIPGEAVDCRTHRHCWGSKLPTRALP